MLSKAVVLALIFALIASPATYKVTSGLLGSWVANGNGCASQQGVLLHAAVFVAVLYALWALKGSRETWTAGSDYLGSRGNKLTAIGKWRSDGGKTRQLFWSWRLRRYVWIPEGASLRQA